LRAKDTAKIIADAYDWKGSIDEKDVLGHDFFIDGVLSMLDGIRGKKKIALVGHNPDISTLASVLMGCDTATCVDFKKNAIMGIDFLGAPAVSAGTLQFYLDPTFLRRFFEE
jgi:phosphohistidine phosphatase